MSSEIQSVKKGQSEPLSVVWSVNCVCNVMNNDIDKIRPPVQVLVFVPTISHLIIGLMFVVSTIIISWTFPQRQTKGAARENYQPAWLG